MEFSRDLSVLALDCYGKSVSRGLKVLDAMTGCGVRGLRYAMEVHDANHVLLNDIRRSASELARKNVDRNKMGDRTEIACMDANLVLALHNAPDTRFDVIDLDPFGSPAPFLDSTVRAASNNAMIAFTATDMPPLCGVRPNAALRKYGGRPLRTEYCHEIGARLLITSLVSTAARHDLGIDVKLTHYADHYIRVYATARHGGMHANQTLSKLGYITHCFHCSYREYSSKLANIEPNCRICGQHYSFAGPLWLGNLYDKTFCRQMLNLVDTKELGKKNRVRRLLKKILEEIDTFPTYYRIDRLSDRFQTPTPKPEHVVEEIRKMGYSASLTHFQGYGVRTDAGPKILEEILRQLSKKTCA
jgi:tRNA (guanine26-N2/guanine27-N2)-dimethyltransferase